MLLPAQVPGYNTNSVTVIFPNCQAMAGFHNNKDPHHPHLFFLQKTESTRSGIGGKKIMLWELPSARGVFLAKTDKFGWISF